MSNQYFFVERIVSNKVRGQKKKNKNKSRKQKYNWLYLLTIANVFFKFWVFFG